MPFRAIPASVWFVAALVPMVASQIVRLQQHDVEAWVFWDYAGRLSALAILAAVPSAREVAFRRERLRMVCWKVAFWIIGIVLFDRYLAGPVRQTINAAWPATMLGAYPRPSGWLYFIDLLFGMALVAYSEEVLFRRCARHVFQEYFKNSYSLVAATSLLFGACHWWAGAGGIVEAIAVGAFLMLLLQRSAALWPVILAHYLTDIVDFM